MNIDEQRLAQHILDAYDHPELDEMTKERVWSKIQARKQSVFKAEYDKFRSIVGQIGAVIAIVVGIGGVYAIMQRPGGFHTTANTPSQSPQPVLTRVTLAGADASNYPEAPIYYPLQRFSFVSPNGQWILLRDKKGNASLEDMSGRKYQVPEVHEGDAIFGSTTDGGVIFTNTFGGGSLTLAYSPQKGIEKTFPGTDKAAKVAFFASESATGNWASLVGNQTGAGPGQKTWLTVNDYPIPSLKAASSVFDWSPDGSKLGVLLGNSGTPQFTLDVYDPKSKHSSVFIHVPNDEIQTLPGEIQLNQMSWSIRGTYIGVGTNHGIYVVNTKTNHLQIVAQSSHVPDWNWISDNQLYVIDHANHARNTVDFYGVKSGAVIGTVLLPGNIEKEHVIGTDEVLMQTDTGALYLVSHVGFKMLCPKGTTVWWFNTKTHNLYYSLSAPPTQVWQLQLTKLGGVNK